MHARNYEAMPFALTSAATMLDCALGDCGAHTLQCPAKACHEDLSSST